MAKRLILLFMMLFMVSFVAAQPQFTTINFDFDDGLIIVDSPQTYLKQGQNYTVNFFVYNKSSGFPLDNSTINCTYYLANNLGELIYNSPVEYSSEDYWEEFISEDYFQRLGVYNYGMKCQNIDVGGATVGTLIVTYTGEYLTEAQSFFYIILFVVFFFLFAMTLFGITKLPESNAKDEAGTILKISYLKYLRPVLWFVAWLFIVAILFISSNLAFAYLEETLFATFLFSMFRVMMGLTFPFVIVWIIWIFAQVVDDKEIRRSWNRGIFPQRL